MFSWGCPFALFWQMYGGGKTSYCLVTPGNTYTESFHLYKEYMLSNDIHVFKKYIEKTKNVFTFERKTCFTLQENMKFTDVHIPDRVIVDLNGYTLECETIDNVGAHVKIINSSSSTASLIINKTCRFGSFANNWYCGYKNSGGNAIIGGNIPLIVTGFGTLVTLDSRNTISSCTIEEGANIIAKSQKCLDCNECIIKGSLNVLSREVFVENTHIIIENTCVQVLFNIGYICDNVISIKGGKGIAGRGLIEGTGKNQRTIEKI